MSLDLRLGGLETVYESLGTLMGILLQPTEVIADSAPDFRFSTNKPGGHAFDVFGSVNVSPDFDFDLVCRAIRQRRVSQGSRVQTDSPLHWNSFSFR